MKPKPQSTGAHVSGGSQHSCCWQEGATHKAGGIFLNQAPQSNPSQLALGTQHSPSALEAAELKEEAAEQKNLADIQLAAARLAREEVDGLEKEVER